MKPKIKKTSLTPRRVYSTRQIMELTEQRRLKSDLENQKPDLKAKDQEIIPADVKEDLKSPQELPVKDIPHVDEEIKKVIGQANVSLVMEAKEKPQEIIREYDKEDLIPVYPNTRPLVLILTIVVPFLMFFFRFSGSWVDAVSSKLNFLVTQGSFLVLNVLMGSCNIEGGMLNTHYYKVSLQGDLLALYSLEILLAFGTIIVFFQKTTWIKKVVILISLFPLAVIVNIFRVVVACGLALNYGIVFANRYFYGGLAELVLIFTLLGLIFLEFLFVSE